MTTIILCTRYTSYSLLNYSRYYSHTTIVHKQPHPNSSIPQSTSAIRISIPIHAASVPSNLSLSLLPAPWLFITSHFTLHNVTLTLHLHTSPSSTFILHPHPSPSPFIPSSPSNWQKNCILHTPNYIRNYLPAAIRQKEMRRQLDTRRSALHQLSIANLPVHLPAHPTLHLTIHPLVRTAI